MRLLSQLAKPWMGLLAVVVATCASYSRTLRAQFVYDDFLQIVFNPRIQSLHWLPSYFSNHVWAQAPDLPANLYRPFFLIWLLANYGISRLNPAGWHAAALLGHLTATVLVYLLAKRLLLGEGGALLATGLFAVHPSHVEAVAWVSAATESLSSVFVLGSFLLYLQWRDRTGSRFLLALGALVLAGFALLTKETSVVLPIIIAAYELSFAPTKAGTEASPFGLRLRRTKALWPFFGLTFLYLVVRFAVLRGLGHSVSDVPLSSAALAVPWALRFYVSQLIFPLGLGPFYDVEYAPSLFSLGFVAPLLFVTACVWGCRWWSRKLGSPLPIFLGLWFLLTLSPPLANLFVMSRYEGVHDRYLYLPSVAFVLLAGLGWQCIADRKPASRLGLATYASLVVAGLGFMTYRQCRFWENDLALFRRGVAVAPRNLMAKLNLAAELRRRGQFAGSLDVTRQALEIDPNHRLALSGAAQSAFFVGRYDLAAQYAAQFLQLGPPQAQETYYLGFSQIRAGHPREGIGVLERGRQLWPDAPGFRLAIGLGHAALGDWHAAYQWYEAELTAFPDSAAARTAVAEASSHLKSSSRVPKMK
jgi:hypothetical protein